MRILVGLGNPGSEYEETRHNVGFQVVERIARHEGLVFESPKSLDAYEGSKRFRVARSFDPDALLVKPQTFMNASGDAVVPLVRWAGVALDELMDDQGQEPPEEPEEDAAEIIDEFKDFLEDLNPEDFA